MRSFSRRTWVFALVVFLAALSGVFIGRALFEVRSKTAGAIHDVLHDQLKLDARQEARIAKLEAEFAVRRRALEYELRADNARLAEAIEAEHGYGPRVTAEVDRSHKAMGELQKATLSHIFAMRAVLRPEQTHEFDRAVVQALTADAQ